MRAILIILFSFATLAVGEDTTATERLATATTWLNLLGVAESELLMTAAKNPQEFSTLCENLQAWEGSTTSVCIPKNARGASNLAKDMANVQAVEANFIKPPRTLERIARVPQFKSEFLRTANYVYGVPEGSPKSATPSILPNPDHGLLSLGGVLDFSELFPNVQSRLDYCAAMRKLNRAKLGATGSVPKQHPNPVEGRSPPDDCSNWNYLAVEGGKRFPERYALATTINVTVSQIPAFQSGVVIPSPGWSETVTGSINPSAWVTSWSDRKALVNYYAKEINMALPRSSCGSNEPGDCLSYLALGGRTRRVVLAFLPRIDVKAYSPFDLAKTSSNTFLALPGGDKALYDFTLTWDLRNTVTSMQMRTDALSAYQMLPNRSLKPQVGQNSKQTSASQELATVKSMLAMKFSRLALDPKLAGEDAWWNALRDDLVTYSLAKQSGSKEQ
jgi:hypothetical protein